jgi:hypothetical protein
MMATREVVIQSCGCIAIPEDVAGALGMTPGISLMMAVDEALRSVTLTSPSGATGKAVPVYAVCPVKA